MKQIIVGLCSFLETDDFCHFIFWIDLLSRWTEAKPIENKDAVTVAQFLYELISRYACFEI